MGYCLCTAKGAAETLKLNMALVLLPVCRNTVTWLRRSRRINSILPFNDTINFHKLIAAGIMIGVILHGGVHLTCDFPRIACLRRPVGLRAYNCRRFSIPPAVLRRHPRDDGGRDGDSDGGADGCSVPAGDLAFEEELRLAAAAHQTTWMYVSIPVVIYTAERVFRKIRSEIYDAKVLEAKVYPGKILSLKMKKPAGFRYRSGMFMFLRCPQISKFEWHPFSLTSAPDDEHLSMHIRSLGDWSYQMYSIFQKALVSGTSDLPKICIDGPYGAASQDHSKYEILLLIGLGIGATPFISILKDIANGLKKVDSGEARDTEIPRKAYFYWVTREQGSFEWFRDIMKDVSALDEKHGVIEMYNYLTSVHQEGDKRSALISAIQALHFTRNGVDIISRTPVRTRFARPNWSRVFSGLACRHVGERIGK
ncbi:Respiratory burst oxidase, partial [Ananas comosus]